MCDYNILSRAATERAKEINLERLKAMNQQCHTTGVVPSLNYSFPVTENYTEKLTSNGCELRWNEVQTPHCGCISSRKCILCKTTEYGSCFCVSSQGWMCDSCKAKDVLTRKTLSFEKTKSYIDTLLQINKPEDIDTFIKDAEAFCVKHNNTYLNSDAIKFFWPGYNNGNIVATGTDCAKKEDGGAVNEPIKCTCDIMALMAAGCKCGALERERKANTCVQ